MKRRGLFAALAAVLLPAAKAEAASGWGRVWIVPGDTPAAEPAEFHFEACTFSGCSVGQIEFAPGMSMCDVRI